MKPTPGRKKLICMVSGICAYLAFHSLRPHLPIGFFRSCFPSLLFIPVALPLVDAMHSLLSKKTDWSERKSTIALATMIGILAFEVIGPLISPIVVADVGDSVALLLGGLLYFQVMRNNKIN